MFDARAAGTAMCGTGGPDALWRRLDRARAVFARAATGSPARSRALIHRGLIALDGVDRLRYRAAQRGVISAGCSGEITRLLRRIQAGAARWDATLS